MKKEGPSLCPPAKQQIYTFNNKENKKETSFSFYKYIRKWTGIASAAVLFRLDKVKKKYLAIHRHGEALKRRRIFIII